MVAALDGLDWSRPWLALYREVGLRVAARVAAGANVAQALNDEAGRHAPAVSGGEMPRFVTAALLPPGTAYEAYIARTSSVPMRDDLHDFYNGLVW